MKHLLKRPCLRTGCGSLPKLPTMVERERERTPAVIATSTQVKGTLLYQFGDLQVLGSRPLDATFGGVVADTRPWEVGTWFAMMCMRFSVCRVFV